MRTGTLTQMKVAELVEDFALYPRPQVDTHHVGSMVQAMNAGASFPPLVAWTDGNRIIDGFHRRRSYARVFGDEREVDVLLVNYADEQEAFEAAMAYNSSHGRNLTTFDRVHSILKASSLGMADERIACALHVDIEYIQSLRVDRCAKSGERLRGEGQKAGETLYVPLKKTIKHMAGKTLTKKQVAANEKLSGMNQLFYANQLITLIENRLLDTANEQLLKALDRLVELVEGLKV